MTQHPFVVNVGTLRRQPGASLRERREGPIPELAVTGSSVPEGRPVVVEVLLESVHGGIMAAQSLVHPRHRGHLLGDVPALFVIAAVLGYLTPRQRGAVATQLTH